MWVAHDDDVYVHRAETLQIGIRVNVPSGDGAAVTHRDARSTRPRIELKRQCGKPLTFFA
jgi:hypothetical protein